MSQQHDILASLQEVEMDAGTVFSGTPSGTPVKGYAQPSPFTPKLNPDYVFHEHSRDLVVWFIAPPSPLYVCGPAGAGKSSMINQLAARLNYPTFEVTGHNHLEFQDLVGHLSVQNGNMVFEYGPLALAMRFGGLLLLNELDLLEPATAAGLNGILDGQPLCIPENQGELIEPHPMFRFAATANTNGGSDETGLYQGTLRMNLALMDRFTVCEVSYPVPEIELRLLKKNRSAIAGYASQKKWWNTLMRSAVCLWAKPKNSYRGNSIEVTFMHTFFTSLGGLDSTLSAPCKAGHPAGGLCS